MTHYIPSTGGYVPAWGPPTSKMKSVADPRFCKHLCMFALLMLSLLGKFLRRSMVDLLLHVLSIVWRLKRHLVSSRISIDASQ